MYHLKILRLEKSWKHSNWKMVIISAVAGQLDVLLLRTRKERPQITRWECSHNNREKKPRIYSQGNCFSSSPTIKHYLLWLNCHSKGLLRHTHLNLVIFFSCLCLPLFILWDILHRVVFLRHQTLSFSFFHELFPSLHLLSRSINMFTVAMAKTSEIYTFPLNP